MPTFHILYKRPIITLTVLYVIALIITGQNGFFSKPRADDPANYIAESTCTITGVILPPVDHKNNRTAFTLQALSINGVPSAGNIQVNYYGKLNIVRAGDTIRFAARIKAPSEPKNPGAFDYSKYLKIQGVYSSANINGFQAISGNGLPFYQELAINIREDILKTIYESMPAVEASILAPMLVGDKSTLSSERKIAFRDAGIMHVLVVSGLNVAYFSALFIFIFRLSGLTRRQSYILSIPLIILYVFITGSNPPVVRAAVMAIFVILSMGLKRDPVIYQSLSISALLILLANPLAIFDASFQLSFAATIGIVYLYPFFKIPFNNTPRWVNKYIGSMFAVSISAQLAVMPLIAYYFNRVQLVGLISNMLIVPLTGIITILGMALYLTHFISSKLTGLTSLLCSNTIDLMLYLTEFFSKVPYANINTVSPNIVLIILYYLLLLTIFHFKKLRLIALVIIFSFTAFLFHTFSIQKSCAPAFKAVIFDTAPSAVIHLSFHNNSNWLLENIKTDSVRKIDYLSKTLSNYFLKQGLTMLDGHISFDGSTILPESIDPGRAVSANESFHIIDSTISVSSGTITLERKLFTALFLVDPAAKIPITVKPDIIFIARINSLEKVSDLISMYEPDYLIFNTWNRRIKEFSGQGTCRILNLKGEGAAIITEEGNSAVIRRYDPASD